jgi:hypothetical protein
MTEERPNTRGVALSLRLYVAQGSPNSEQAWSNLQAVLEDVGLAAEVVEIVDVFEDPAQAFADGVVLTPMLVRTAPLPQVRVIGTLNDRNSLLRLVTTDG